MDEYGFYAVIVTEADGTVHKYTARSQTNKTVARRALAAYPDAVCVHMTVIRPYCGDEVTEDMQDEAIRWLESHED